MAVSSRAVCELILLGPTHDRRQLQDSPVLGDVWIAYATNPGDLIDLLISPRRGQAAGPVATEVANRLRKVGERREPGKREKAAHVAYLQGIVAARLYFSELLRVVVPMTGWWVERKVREKLEKYEPQRLESAIRIVIDWAQATKQDERVTSASGLATFTALDRYVILAGLILTAAARQNDIGGLLDELMREVNGPSSVVGELARMLDSLRDDAKKWEEGRTQGDDDDALERQMIWQVSLNRKAMPALERSVPAVKGDAARELFKVRCDKITWAVLDSGIDRDHPVFRVARDPKDAKAKDKSRVERSFDFSNIREVVSLDNIDEANAKEKAKTLIEGRNITLDDAVKGLRLLAEDADNDRPINWGLVEPFIEIPEGTKPQVAGGHGTHVGGIIGADGHFERREGDDRKASYFDGMCPDIRLYDLRVLGKTLQDTEFAIIAALQYIRYLNERHTYISVHGANLSLSIPHDVRNFACGRTPVCNECERLVESGVVVVAAAGNFGYQSFETKEGSYEGYTAFSITDPGNADGVITVGATHRSWPHTYGVSFFSSRGPTGDGRLKPDLVAPGERIQSCLPLGDGGVWGEMDGTSMAAPHVSGAAAMLMARYSELIGQPRRIKQILCDSATDLGRERSFQGRGMLDVLRAFQKI